MRLYSAARKVVGKLIRSVPWLRRQIYVSCDYAVITPQDAATIQDSGWFSPYIVRRQQRAYESLLADMRAGRLRRDLQVAAEALDTLELAALSLLEVGCGGGYYNKVFSYLPKTKVNYTGLDYSPAMIARARLAYPDVHFVIGDATALKFSDGAFDVVFNGVSLMHIPNYPVAIAESRRVARRAAIFHSVPVLERHQTTYVSKYAYGGQVVEVIFNRAELLACFENAGLKLEHNWRTINYDVGHLLGESSHAETFLCVPR